MLTHIRPWNPLAELESFGRELERAFGAAEAAGRPHGRWNIYAGDDGVTLTAELPGYDPERFAIEVVGEHLKIAGGRTVARGEGDRAVLNERRDESFEETLALGFAPADDAVDAAYEHGVLTISVAKPAAEQPRKIAVRV